jgi:hypothetical protein
MKASSGTGNWFLTDNMRGMSYSGGNYLLANTSGAEVAGNAYLRPTATGFGTFAFGPGSLDYIYIAIRRGPMKVPTSGTSVYYPFARAGNDTQTDVTGVGFTPDLWMVKDRTLAADFPFFDRLRGVTKRVVSNSTNAEETFSGSNGLVTLNMDGITIGAGAFDGGICNDTGSNYGNWLLRRAPSFFDEVCYTGNNVSGRTITHNLAAVPELMIVKSRTSTTRDWMVYDATNGATKAMNLNNDSVTSSSSVWASTAPTSTVFTVSDSSSVNDPAQNYVAYLFATCAGVSKVFSFTGNGSTQTINCGFTGGARFVLLKASSATGGWFVYDTARGMTVLTDPYLQLNTTAAEVATLGSVTTVSTGFAVNEAITTGVNTNGVTYIGLAIA